MRVLNVVPGTEVRMVEECSAVDGTWGMKARHYATGQKYAQKLVRGVESGGDAPDVVLSDCSLASLRIAHETGRRILHPIEAVAHAYGLIDVLPTVAGGGTSKVLIRRPAPTALRGPTPCSRGGYQVFTQLVPL